MENCKGMGKYDGKYKFPPILLATHIANALKLHTNAIQLIILPQLLAGNRLFQSKEFKQAADQYTQALQHDATHFKVLNNLASSYFNLGDYRSRARQGRQRGNTFFFQWGIQPFHPGLDGPSSKFAHWRCDFPLWTTD